MTTTRTQSTTIDPPDAVPQHVVQSILQALHGLRFGQVTVIVQDGRVMQIDRTERHRFPNEK